MTIFIYVLFLKITLVYRKLMELYNYFTYEVKLSNGIQINLCRLNVIQFSSIAIDNYYLAKTVLGIAALKQGKTQSS